jgi:hypothetical protein
MAMIHDVVLDTLFEENLIATLENLGQGRLIMDRENPEEPFLTDEEGYLIVRLKNGDPIAFSRELERRTAGLRIVTVVDRTPETEE